MRANLKNEKYKNMKDNKDKNRIMQQTIKDNIQDNLKLKNNMKIIMKANKKMQYSLKINKNRQNNLKIDEYIQANKNIKLDTEEDLNNKIKKTIEKYLNKGKQEIKDKIDVIKLNKPKKLVSLRKVNMKDVLRVLFGKPKSICRKYMFFFKRFSNFFLFKYDIFNFLFINKKFFYIKNNFLHLNNFNNKFIFFSISKNKKKIFNNYYNRNILDLKRNDYVTFEYLLNKQNLLINFVKKAKK